MVILEEPLLHVYLYKKSPKQKRPFWVAKGLIEGVFQILFNTYLALNHEKFQSQCVIEKSISRLFPHIHEKFIWPIPSTYDTKMLQNWHRKSLLTNFIII